MKNITFAEIKDQKELAVAVYHAGDYFGGDEGCENLTVAEFIENYLQHMIDDSAEDGDEPISVEEAFGFWHDASGDGDENYALLAVIDGKIVNVVGE